jgi:hypothetical protein
MEDSAKAEKKIKVEVIKEEPEVREETETQEKKEEAQVKPEQEKNEEQEQISPSQETKTKIKKERTPFWILFLTFLLGLTLGAGLIGGIFYYKLKVEKVSSTPSTPTPVVTTTISEPKETPKPEVKLSDLKVLILNGSGIKGEAGKVEELVKKTGFEKTETGNADSYNYQETVVFLKDNLDSSIYDKISESLSGYSLKKDTLEESSAYDIKIIVGKTKK